MSRVAASDAIWAFWLALFLLFELGGFFGVFPWDTLSSTAWLNEKLHPILRTLLFGFLVGLAVHIRFQTGLWRTTVGGLLIAVVLDFLWTSKTPST